MGKFILNGWYGAGWSHEVQGDTVLSRRLLDMPVALYRTAEGTAVAMLDKCPHRFAPMTKGRRDGDVLVCGYHGLRFDASGACVGSPFNKDIPEGTCIRMFPVVERHNMLWLWPGDSAQADPALIPDFSDLDDMPGPHGYLTMAVNYLLAVDNLMDLSHIEFVHTGSFGGGGAFFGGEHSMEVEPGGAVWSRWSMPGAPVPVPLIPSLGKDARVNHWQDMKWMAPSNLAFYLGIVPLDVPLRADGKSRAMAHVLTPETEHSTHYFFSVAPSGTGAKNGPEMVRIAFEDEDRPMMEACYANMEKASFWDERPLVLGTDKAGILVRRTIERMIREEAARAG